ncbi:hypothetical protein H5203_21305 [Pseudoalteromonas sp. SG41-1]|uniref:hypothetical protein n=1 Tax=Pseudoalteromonas sp. SG41-1 TaxID=2760979 RepID=UPI001601F548|nr:hypothetical protein [Pseudoalteromonas sp. SG41-1]MBB1507984.1 hypothetical protein [Pseudoalteromonas sp. SG41-1]
MSKYNKEYVEKLYKEKNHKEVSRLVKERLISNEDRDEWLLNLASRFNHNNLAKALIQIPSVKVNDAFDWAVYNDNEELTYSLLKNREDEINLDIKKHFIDSIFTEEFNTLKGAILAKPELVNELNDEDIFSIAKAEREDILTLAFNNFEESKFREIIINLEFSDLDQKEIDIICSSIENITNVSEKRALSIYKFDYSHSGQKSALSIIDKLGIPDFEKEDIYVRMNKMRGLKGFKAAEKNLIAERIKEEISAGKNFSEDNLFNLIEHDFDSRSSDNSVSTFIFNNNNEIKKRVKEELPEIYNELNKQRVKDNVMSF